MLIKALSGLPGFSYSTADVVDGTIVSADAWTELKTADTLNYIMAAGTAGNGND